MTRYIGNEIDFTVGGTSVPCVISVSDNPSMETVDTSCPSEDDKTSLAGQKSDSYTVEFLDATDNVGLDLFARQSTALECVYYPQGNSSGKPSETFSAFVTGKPRTVTHKSVTSVSVSLEVTGGVTKGTVA